MEIDYNLVKEILIIITSIGTLISSLAALFTVIELKKQRNVSYIPEILLDDSRYSLFISPNIFETYPMSFLKTDLNEKESYTESELNNREQFLQVELYNVGIGTAKKIETEWDFNFRKASKVLEKYFNDDWFASKYDGKTTIRYKKSNTGTYDMDNDGALFVKKQTLFTEVVQITMLKKYQYL